MFGAQKRTLRIGLEGCRPRRWCVDLTGERRLADLAPNLQGRPARRNTWAWNLVPLERTCSWSFKAGPAEENARTTSLLSCVWSVDIN